MSLCAFSPGVRRTRHLDVGGIREPGCASPDRRAVKSARRGGRMPDSPASEQVEAARRRVASARVLGWRMGRAEPPGSGDCRCTLDRVRGAHLRGRELGVETGRAAATFVTKLRRGEAHSIAAAAAAALTVAGEPPVFLTFAQRAQTRAPSTVSSASFALPSPHVRDLARPRGACDAPPSLGTTSRNGGHR
jgi:hypothetical protein